MCRSSDHSAGDEIVREKLTKSVRHNLKTYPVKCQLFFHRQHDTHVVPTSRHIDSDTTGNTTGVATSKTNSPA